MVDAAAVGKSSTDKAVFLSVANQVARAPVPFHHPSSESLLSRIASGAKVPSRPPPCGARPNPSQGSCGHELRSAFVTLAAALHRSWSTPPSSQAMTAAVHRLTSTLVASIRDDATVSRLKFRVFNI
jgi:hypothetical protein